MDANLTTLVKRLKVTLNALAAQITEAGSDAINSTAVHKEMLSELQGQLNILEKSRVAKQAMEENHVREMTTIDMKVAAMLDDKSLLKADDRDDTICMLLVPKKTLESQYSRACEAWKIATAKKEARAKETISRARSMLAYAKEAAHLEGLVRAAVQREHVQTTARLLLEDGICVWVSRTNQFATLMTECLLQVSDSHLVFVPTRTCFDQESITSLRETYELDHTCIDMGKRTFNIDLRGVREIKYIKRRANVPGSFDEKSPHYVPPKYHRCVHIQCSNAKEYFVTDRRNDPKEKTWGSLQGAMDGSESLLCQKLLELWARTTHRQS